MRIAFHRLITGDLDDIRNYFLETESAAVADAFYQEFRASVIKAAERPLSFQAREDGVRRCNLRRFPFHFLFRITGEGIRVLVIRHNRRHPSLGTKRK